MWDVLDARFSKERGGFDIIHKNTGMPPQCNYAFDLIDLQV